MRLYLVQHGEALSKEVDPERGLSAKGRRDVERLGALLYADSVHIAELHHSGKTRAAQTAELIVAAMSLNIQPSALPGIAPNDPVEPIASLAGEWTSDTLLVGHQPFMGRLAARLCCGQQDRVEFQFAPGTCVCVERHAQDTRWALAFMLPPLLNAV